MNRHTGRVGYALLLVSVSLLVNAYSGAEASMPAQSIAQCEPSGRLSVALYGGIRTELKRGQTVKETPANVTVMEEGGGRFYNSSDASTCLAGIVEQKPRSGGTEDEYLIGGVLYCVAAITELNGSGGLSLSDLRFSGHLNWMPPE